MISLDLDHPLLHGAPGRAAALQLGSQHSECIARQRKPGDGGHRFAPPPLDLALHAHGTIARLGPGLLVTPALRDRVTTARADPSLRARIHDAPLPAFHSLHPVGGDGERGLPHLRMLPLVIPRIPQQALVFDPQAAVLDHLDASRRETLGALVIADPEL